MHSRRSILAAIALTSGALSTREIRQRSAFAAGATPEAAVVHGSDLIVDSVWLRDRLGSKGVKVIALQDEAGFEQGHIPGSAQTDWDKLDLPVTTESNVEMWRKTMARLFGQLGVEPDDTVVAYDPGTFYAARIWWALDQLGHADKRLLSGGLPAWTAAGEKSEIGASIVQPTVTSLPVIANDAGIATIDEVIAAVDSKSATFLDARTPKEYSAGHIPSAINVPMLTNAVDGSIHYWKSVSDLTAMYVEVGITSEKLVIPYCSTGVRSANTFLALRVIGHDNVSLFSGSWREWTTHSNLPVTTGDQP